MESSRGLLETSARRFIKLHVKKAETGRYDSKIAGDPYFPKHEPYPEDESGRPMMTFPADRGMIPFASAISMCFPRLISPSSLMIV
jgi:hypothetical protein